MYGVEVDGDWTVFTGGPFHGPSSRNSHVTFRDRRSDFERHRASSSATSSGRRDQGPLLLPPWPIPDSSVEVFSMSPRADAEIEVDDGWTLTSFGSDTNAPGTPDTSLHPEQTPAVSTPELRLAGITDLLQPEPSPLRVAAEQRANPTGNLALISLEFVHVAPTLMTLFRSFALRRHGVACAFLWVWLTILVLGELATTIWWINSLGVKGVVLLIATAVTTVLLALSVVSPEQVIAIATSLFVAAIPALPAYSAVLLVVPSELDNGSQNSCWEALHLPTLAALATMYIASALLPALYAECPSPGYRLRAALSVLEAAQRMARGACILTLWVYFAVAIHVAGIGLNALGQQGASWRWRSGLPSLPVSTGRGFVLALHALGLVCAETRVRTVATLGDDLLPSLFGAERAKSLTLRALALQHGRGLLRRMPTLRRCVPPKVVVAFIISLRRTAPVLLPGFALLTQLIRVGLPRLSALLGFVILVLICAIASREWLRLPHSPLRRLPLLLPPKVAPCTRKVLGFALAAAEGLADAHAGIACLGIVRRRFRGLK